MVAGASEKPGDAPGFLANESLPTLAPLSRVVALDPLIVRGAPTDTGEVTFVAHCTIGGVLAMRVLVALSAVEVEEVTKRQA